MTTDRLVLALREMISAYAEGHDDPNDEPTMVRDAILAVREAEGSRPCLSKVGVSLCTREAGHIGEHRCLASDVDGKIKL